MMLRLAIIAGVLVATFSSLSDAQIFRRWRSNRQYVTRTYTAPAQPALPAATTQTSDLEQRLIAAVNAYRADRGLPALEVDDVLMRLARERVTVFHHRHPRHGWIHEHAPRLGWNGYVTDNIAQGYPTPEAAVGDATTGWGSEVNSVGHNLQMLGYQKHNGRWLNRRYNRIGATCRGGNYIAVFGRRF